MDSSDLPEGAFETTKLKLKTMKERVQDLKTKLGEADRKHKEDRVLLSKRVESLENELQRAKEELVFHGNATNYQKYGCKEIYDEYLNIHEVHLWIVSLYAMCEEYDLATILDAIKKMKNYDYDDLKYHYKRGCYEKECANCIAFSLLTDYSKVPLDEFERWIKYVKKTHYDT